MEPIIVVAVLAILGELIIEAVKPALEPAFVNVPQNVNPYLYLSLGLGVGLALLFQADLLAAVGLVSPYVAAVWVGRVATGLIIGRGANFAHDAISRLANPGAPEPSN